MRPRWRDVKGSDLRALIGRPQGSVRVRDDLDCARSIWGVAIQAVRAHRCGEKGTELQLLVKGIGGLEPGTCESQVPLNCILVRKFVVKAVEKVLFVAPIVQHFEFRRIEKPAGVQAIDSDKVSPLGASITEIEPGEGRTKRTVGGVYAAVRGGDAQARTCRRYNHNAGLASVFSWWCALDDLQGLNRIERNLI